MSSDFEPESRWPNFQLSHRVSRLFRSFRRDAEPSVDYSYYELSGIDEADTAELPTDEERETLRRVADAVPWNAFRKFMRVLSVSRMLTPRFQVIAFVELAERFSYYGTTVVFVSTLQDVTSM